MSQLAPLLFSYGWLGLLALAWVGLCVGSFLNVVVHRLPIMLQRSFEAEARDILEQPAQTEAERYNLMVPRSACPECGHQIRAWENIPVLSWLALRGRCSNCSTPISARYPLVELLTMALTLVAVAQFGFTWAGLGACVFTWMLIAATFIDADTMLLPDQLTLPLLWMGLLLNITGTFVPLTDAVVGAVAGYLALWSIYWLFKLITGKEGMGYGDFKLLAAVGAWLGWAVLPYVVLLAAVSGLIFAVMSMVVGKMRRDQPMPFGPYLAAGGWLAMVLQERLQTFMI